MVQPEFCIRCDKRLSQKEVAALTEQERKYFFILCSKCKKLEQKEIEEIIDSLGDIEDLEETC